MEQRSYREPDQTKSQSYTANHLPRIGEERKKSLESGSSQLDAKRQKNLH